MYVYEKDPNVKYKEYYERGVMYCHELKDLEEVHPVGDGLYCNIHYYDRMDMYPDNDLESPFTEQRGDSYVLRSKSTILYRPEEPGQKYKKETLLYQNGLKVVILPGGSLFTFSEYRPNEQPERPTWYVLRGTGRYEGCVGHGHWWWYWPDELRERPELSLIHI